MENLVDKGTRAKKQPKWEREEVVLLVTEYFRTRDLPRSEKEKSITFLNKFLRARAVFLGLDIDDTYRNVKGIEMKFGNIQSLDKDKIEEGRVGLRAVSRLDREIVMEYYENENKIVVESYMVLMKYEEILLNTQ